MGTGGVASVHLGKGKYAYSTDTWAIRIKESAKLTQPYAYRVLELSLPKIDYAGFEGSGLRHLRKSYIKDFRFLAPSDSAPQKRIVSILDGIDTAIEKTEALIAKYQQIKAGLMHDLFTRGVLPNGKLRPPREQAPELYQETAIGWIPREWGVKPCADLCSRICVGIVIQPTQYYVEDGVPAFRSANVREDGIDPNNFVYISAGANRLLAKSQVKTGDIVSVRTGYPGTSAVIPPEFQGANCIDILISTPNEKVTSEYLCDWINSSFGKGQVLRQQGGMAQQHFNVGEMRELLVALPDLNEQERIRGKIKSVSGKLAIEKALAEKLQAQKSGLMHDLLTGKVPVNIKKTTTTEVAA
jgi:type I restriction enzyme S subunit